MHDPKIKNIGYIYKYTLYKTTKSQTVEHFYQTAQSAWCTVKSATISDNLTCNPPVEIEDHYLRPSHRNIIHISHR